MTVTTWTADGGLHVTFGSEVRDCPELIKIVDGLMTHGVQFDGPKCAVICGKRIVNGMLEYDMLCSDGLNNAEEDREWYGRFEAIDRYATELRRYLRERTDEGYGMFAWRQRPELRYQDDGQWYVYSRLVVL